MADIINLFYEGEFAHQPAVCIAESIGNVFFALAFDRSFHRQRGTLAIGLPDNPSHVKRFHSRSLDVDLPTQSSVGRLHR